MSRDLRAVLADVVAHIDRARRQLGGRTADELAADETVLDAVVHNVQIVGEAVKRLSAGVRDRAPGVAWSEAARMRDRLAHRYWDVAPEVVWDVVVHELPVIRDAAAGLLAELDAEGPPPT